MFKLNGKNIDFKENLTISNLLKNNNFNEDLIVVELNGKILTKSEYNRTILRNDEIEVVTFVGGG